MTVEIVTDENGLSRIEDRWRDLAESAGNAFLTPEWFRCWLDAPDQAGDWAVAVVHGERERFDGVLPLVVEGPRGRRTLRFPGRR